MEEKDMHLVLHEISDAFEDAMNEKEKWRLMFKCYDALIFLLEGNYNEALAKIQDLCAQHATLAIVHRCYAEILARSVNEHNLEDDELQRRRDEAIKEARTAVSLAPDDAEMARFLARMLLTQAKTRQDFEEASRVCETLLGILNPAAHGLERLEANSESVFPEDRLEMILIDLEILKANSTVEVDRIKLLPSMEEKVREAEVEDPPSSEQQQQSSARASESSGEIFGAGERSNIDRRRNLVRSYLNGLTVDEKKALLKVKISDLRIYFESLGADSKRLATTVLFDALKCAESKNWSDCKCRDCGRKFFNDKLLIQHSLQGHIGKLILPEAKPLLPKKEWIEMLLQGPPSSSDSGASDEITSCYLDACATLALLDVEEKDYDGEEDQSQASNSDFIIAFDRSSSCPLLVLDEHKLPNGCDVESFLSSLADEIEERGFPGTCEELRTWSNGVHKAEKPGALFISLQKELTLINLILEKKCEHLKYMKELLALADQYAQESVHAEAEVGFSENYWAMIRKRRYELFELGDKEAFAGIRFKMKALSNMLKDAYSQEPDSRERLPRAVFRRQMNKAEEELKKFSAELKPKLDHVEQLLYKELVPTSTVDYETILLTLLKSFIQKRLEDSAEQKEFLKVYTESEAAKARRRMMKKKGKSISQ